MSKRTSTRWYIGAWVGGALAVIVFYVTAHREATGTAFYAFATSPISFAACLVLIATSIVMVVTWIGALIRAGQLRRWGWFVALLVLQLLGLGIAGMIASAAAGPEGEEIVYRPTTT